jgi:hypothetical protein
MGRRLSNKVYAQRLVVKQNKDMYMGCIEGLGHSIHDSIQHECPDFLLPGEVKSLSGEGTFDIMANGKHDAVNEINKRISWNDDYEDTYDEFYPPVKPHAKWKK